MCDSSFFVSLQRPSELSAESAHAIPSKGFTGIGISQRKTIKVDKMQISCTHFLYFPHLLAPCVFPKYEEYAYTDVDKNSKHTIIPTMYTLRSP